jgi:heme exporter protein A
VFPPLQQAPFASLLNRGLPSGLSTLNNETSIHTALESRLFDNYIRATRFSVTSKIVALSGSSTLRVAVRHLSKAYGYFWALRDLTLNLAAGECIALFGPNGAGKTTVLKLLAGLIYPTSGEIQINDAKLSRAALALRSNIGFLSPSDHLYDNLTVRENLDFFKALYNKNLAGSAIATALDILGLRRWSGEYVAALSSGMKCRLSIAKWQLLEPGLLLLDEPYGVLDGSGVDLLESFLKAHCDKGGIVVIASHHISRVLQLCDRALILHQGKLTFDERRRQPWDSFYRAFGEFLPRGPL